MDILFFANSILLGVGLAMDAFSVSVANGLSDPGMKTKRTLIIAGTFGMFQFAMPLIGWYCVHAVAEAFSAFQKYIPWIALILLSYIGGKMIFESLRGNEDEAEGKSLGGWALIVQGIATSIDALSVGFTIASYNAAAAFVSSLIIGIVTFIICVFGLKAGKTIGTRLSGKAEVFGGAILIFIGIEIFVKSFL